MGEIKNNMCVGKDESSVSIIILSWNSKTLLNSCLNSLIKKTEYSNFQIIVVDNGSKDGSVAWIKKEFPIIDILDLGNNHGFSVGNNIGIAYALKKFNPKHVLLLNNDTEILQENWLQKLVWISESQRFAGIIGPELIYPNGQIQYIGTKLDQKGLSWLKPQNFPKLPEVYPVDCVLGACFLIKKEVIDKIGGLDSGFSPYGHEESDFCIRAKKAGYKSCMVSSVKVMHQNRASLSKVNAGYLRFIAKKNQIRFMLLNFPLKWLVRRLPYEVFFSCFITRNISSKSGIPIKFRHSKDMLVEVKSCFKAILLNTNNFKEIICKRQNRTMRLPLENIN